MGGTICPSERSIAGPYPQGLHSNPAKAGICPVDVVAQPVHGHVTCKGGCPEMSIGVIERCCIEYYYTSITAITENRLE